jgi:thioredoxin reductase
MAGFVRADPTRSAATKDQPIAPKASRWRAQGPARYVPSMTRDVVIVGGGPAGLSAALTLGRARTRVLLCDAGPRRNATAQRVHGFVTQDGTPPNEFRRIAREQLQPYTNVELRDVGVDAIAGEVDHFCVTLADGRLVEARHVLLAVGMIDVLPELPGVRELWGKAIFQCPYCHGWENRDRSFGYLAPSEARLDWARFLLGWSADVTVFTDGRIEVPGPIRERLEQAGVAIEERRLRALIGSTELEAIEFEDGQRLARAVLFMHPPQRQTELVAGLGLALDQHGFVVVDGHHRTSRPGIYAAGDLSSPMQAALLAAAAGTNAAHMINHELTFATPRA